MTTPHFERPPTWEAAREVLTFEPCHIAGRSVAVVVWHEMVFLVTSYELPADE